MYYFGLLAHSVVSFHCVSPKLAVFSDFHNFANFFANIMYPIYVLYMSLYILISVVSNLAFNELLIY